MRIKKLLDSIGRDVDTVSPDETVYDALALMAKKEIGALVVVENGKTGGNSFRTGLRPQDYPQGQKLQENPGAGDNDLRCHSRRP